MSLKQPEATSIDGNLQLTKDYTYYWEAAGYKQMMTVKKGFVWDGASVPKSVWWTGIRPDGLIRAASLIHDYLYRYSGKIPHTSHLYFKDGGWYYTKHKWTRKEADKIFCRIMREAGVPKWKRRTAYYAVRLFGWTAWK